MLNCSKLNAKTFDNIRLIGFFEKAADKFSFAHFRRRNTHRIRDISHEDFHCFFCVRNGREMSDIYVQNNHAPFPPVCRPILNYADDFCSVQY